MEFGILKTKIEESLVKSYTNKGIKKDMFLFNELVLENKSIARLYFLYDELSENKNLDDVVASEFINESVKIYNQISKEISKNSLKEINMWVGHIKCENRYKDVDNLFSKNIISLEDKLKSKSSIMETLMKKKESLTETKLDLPLEKIVDVANKTVNNYLSQLDESEKKNILKVLKEDDSKLEIEFNVIKESVVTRLNNLKKDEDDAEVVSTIQETISKVEKEFYTKDNYLKLKKLNNTI
jgi:hypothetical protein